MLRLLYTWRKPSTGWQATVGEPRLFLSISRREQLKERSPSYHRGKSFTVCIQVLLPCFCKPENDNANGTLFVGQLLTFENQKKLPIRHFHLLIDTPITHIECIDRPISMRLCNSDCINEVNNYSRHFLFQFHQRFSVLCMHVIFSRLILFSQQTTTSDRSPSVWYQFQPSVCHVVGLWPHQSAGSNIQSWSRWTVKFF